MRRRLEFLRCAVVPFFLSQRLFLFLELVLGGGLIKFYGTLIFFLIYDLPLPYIVKVDLKIILRRPWFPKRIAFVRINIIEDIKLIWQFMNMTVQGEDHCSPNLCSTWVSSKRWHVCHYTSFMHPSGVRRATTAIWTGYLVNIYKQKNAILIEILLA